MARRRYRSRRHYGRPRFFRRRSRKMTIPLAPILGLAAGLAEPVMALANGQAPESAANIAIRAYTGYDIFSHDWGWQRMINGVLPLAVGLLVHKFVGGRPLNVNASLAKANVPFIRI